LKNIFLGGVRFVLLSSMVCGWSRDRI